MKTMTLEEIEKIGYVAKIKGYPLIGYPMFIVKQLKIDIEI